MNFAAVDKALEHLVEIPIPPSWGKDVVRGLAWSWLPPPA